MYYIGELVKGSLVTNKKYHLVIFFSATLYSLFLSSTLKAAITKVGTTITAIFSDVAIGYSSNLQRLSFCLLKSLGLVYRLKT